MNLSPKSKLYTGVQVLPQYTGRKTAGYMQDLEADGSVGLEGDTSQCVHCQAMWRIRPGSGIKRGWCWNCSGPTCSKQHCIEHCEPAEAFIERLEAEGNAAHQSRQNAKVMAK